MSENRTASTKYSTTMNIKRKPLNCKLSRDYMTTDNNNAAFICMTKLSYTFSDILQQFCAVTLCNNTITYNIKPCEVI